MATIPGISASSLYATQNNTANKKSDATQVAASQYGADSTSVSLSSGSSPVPLTYDVTGLLNAFRQAAAGQSSDSTDSAQTPQQTAQKAVLSAQNAITQAQASLTADSSSDSSSDSDIFSLIGTTGDGSPQSTQTPSSGSVDQQSAQQAVFNAQYALTQALASLSTPPKNS